MLSDLKLSRSYRKGRDDIAGEFYIPCFLRAKKYDRAVGFFSSAIYLLAWDALADFVKAGGRIRIVCSPFLSEPDIDALTKGYESKREGDFSLAASQVIERMLEDESRRKPTKVLASLVSIGALDLRVAFIGPNQVSAFSRLFHDKVGLFFDDAGAVVAFKGSMNETWNGLSNDGNIESIDVYVSWEHERERARVLDEVAYFESLWSNQYPSTTVRPFPDAARDRLLSVAAPNEWERLLEEVRAESRESRQLAADRRPTGHLPKPHQIDAIRNWILAGRRGILEHATGSGKTFTAICAIREEMERGKVPLVVVPSDLLQKQWYAELKNHLSELSPRILRCGAGENAWRESNLLGPWSRPSPDKESRIILSTVQTAARAEFLARLRGGDHLFFVADEVHRFGSGIHKNTLKIDSGPRLGLSATPTRFGDPDGTKAIVDYFGEAIRPPFTVNDAIKVGTLTPYFYLIRIVTLTEDEQQQWDKSTRDISVFYARHRAVMPERPDLRARFNQLLIERARVIKGASDKVPVSVGIVKEHFRQGEKWLVYCEDQFQLGKTLSALRREGLPASEYHSAMRGDRERALEDFQINGGVLVSIKCLDEGVDIPSVSHALIMASSKNPREFIQRRGRVLRRFEGKAFAHIYDLVVVPSIDDGDQSQNAIVTGELARAAEFGRSATNPSAAVEIERIASRYKIDIATLAQLGMEDDIDDQ